MKLSEHEIQAPSLCGRLPRPRVSFRVCTFVIISLKKVSPKFYAIRTPQAVAPLRGPQGPCPRLPPPPGGGTGRPVALTFLSSRGSGQHRQSGGLWNERPTLGRFVCLWAQRAALEDFLGSLLAKRLLDNHTEPRSFGVSAVSRS